MSKKFDERQKEKLILVNKGNIKSGDIFFN